MQTTTEPSSEKEQGRLSWRNSVLIWVFGAVLGWVVAVVAVYSSLRTDSNGSLIATEQSSMPNDRDIADDLKARDLNEVMPAAGEDVGGQEP